MWKSSGWPEAGSKNKIFYWAYGYEIKAIAAMLQTPEANTGSFMVRSTLRSWAKMQMFGLAGRDCQKMSRILPPAS